MQSLARLVELRGRGDGEHTHRHAYNSTLNGDSQKCVIGHFNLLTCGESARYCGRVALVNGEEVP